MSFLCIYLLVCLLADLSRAWEPLTKFIECERHVLLLFFYKVRSTLTQSALGWKWHLPNQLITHVQ